ncbi:Alpha/Beta hydrolase protein [Mycena sp. CBHHK59/15]|nr:Alpha/Beta hydrolase protein [Mycena sp. CBHHK59/15]
MELPRAGPHSTCVLPDGAVLAYEVLGATHLGHGALPLVLVGGMASTREDWIRLSMVWAESRPVLVYDHRGMGDSTCSVPDEVDEFTMETLARDLAFLIGHLGWKDVAILGFSMGGVVVQQLLALAYHPTEPMHLPFRPTHVILASTRSEVLSDPRYGLPVPAPGDATQQPLSYVEKYERVRRTAEATVDPSWLATLGPIYMDFIVQRVLSGSKRPLPTLSRQKQALQSFDFAALLGNLPKELPVLVLHGEADQIIPFECSQVMLQRIPGARFIEIGPEPGQLPTLQFGHNFTLYFPAKIWGDVVNKFLGSYERVEEPVSAVPPENPS